MTRKSILAFFFPRRNAEEQIILLRRSMALLALIFPWVFVVYSLANSEPIKGSLSAYYWDAAEDHFARNFFVSMLSVLGLYLLLYRSDNKHKNRFMKRLEVWLAIPAGVLALIVAFVPTDMPALDSSPVHRNAAIAFFVLILLISLIYSGRYLFLGRRQSPLYCGYLGSFILSVVAVYAAIWHFRQESYASMLLLVQDNHNILILEIVGISAFGLYWIIRTMELHPKENRNEC